MMISIAVAAGVAVWLGIGYGTYWLVYKYTDDPLEKMALHEGRLWGILAGPLTWIFAAGVWICDLAKGDGK